ncbi:ATP-dependent DNA helicase RecQ [Methanorbis furvi]|uniref:DNA 3'-5' helicase n=1 Tax=Methanorbis furvi TaxID=3028299 RepID=A0AAE4S9K4_9EURY|nr:ATP-dependent DNA helicase RecQ [Methanocorpusculaceae archaeon Ag1]
MTQDIQKTLEAFFHHQTFRPNQEAIISDVVAGRDVLAVMATGGGKSLCYQLPAMMLEGMTVVISPLIALMKDQVDALSAQGVRVGTLNSTQTYDEKLRVEREISSGSLRILYVSPERAVTPAFFQVLSRCRVALFAVDEAHCISMWGHQFRPEYREIKVLREKFPNVPVIALTATATERVREDIVRELGMKNPREYVGSFNRKNLRYEAYEESIGMVRIQRIVSYVVANPNVSGIIYCFSRASCEEIAERLRRHHILASPYHAGMPTPERNRIQEGFLNNTIRVICATVAFGMGIDKPDVRYVIHAHLPKDLESYYQETGRAGRDGKPSDCILYYSSGDRAKISSMLEREFTDTQRLRIAKGKIADMYSYCTTSGCRRKTLLSYFGEDISPCKNCDICDRSNTKPKKIAAPSGDLSKIVFDAAKDLSGQMTMSSFVSFLLGLDRAHTKSSGLTTHSFYGAAKDYDRAEVMGVVQDLVASKKLFLKGKSVMKLCVAEK